MDNRDTRFQNEREALRAALGRLDAAEGALAEARGLLDALVRGQETPVAPPAALPAPQPTSRALLGGEHGSLSSGRAPIAPYPAPPRPTRAKKNQGNRESTLIRAVAVGGVLITLVGVAFFVAVAIQAGLLGPLGRVVLAYLVAAALLAAAHRFRASAPPAATSALVVTSLYSALATTWLTTTWLGWLPVFLAAVVMVALYAAIGAYDLRAGGRDVTAIWLAVGAALSTFFFPLAADEGINPLPVFLFPLVMAAFAVAFRSHTIQRLAALSALLALGSLLLADGQGQPWILTLVAGILALALGSAGAKYPLGGEEWSRVFATGAVPAVLLPAAAIYLDAVGPNWLAVVLALALLAIGLRMKEAAVLRVWGLAALPIVVLCTAYPDAVYRQQVAGSPLYWRAATVVVFFGLLVALLPTLREAWAMSTWAFVTVMLTGTLADYVLGWRSHAISVEAFLVAVVLLVALVAVATIPGRLPEVGDKWVQVAGLLVALYLSMLSVVGILMRVGSVFGHENGAFLCAHALVSIAWMVLAARFMLSPRGRFTNVGAVLAIVAVIKLVFFDLSALNGVARAFAFLLCGIVLLTIAVRRSAVVKEAGLLGAENVAPNRGDGNAADRAQGDEGRRGEGDGGDGGVETGAGGAGHGDGDRGESGGGEGVGQDR